jgi:hypothetical protein
LEAFRRAEPFLLLPYFLYQRIAFDAIYTSKWTGGIEKGSQGTKNADE